MNTQRGLVDLLNKELSREVIKNDEFANELITNIRDKAMRGYYHDFLSPIATPKMTLHRDLLQANLGELAKDVARGRFDDENPEDTI